MLCFVQKNRLYYGVLLLVIVPLVMAGCASRNLGDISRLGLDPHYRPMEVVSEGDVELLSESDEGMRSEAEKVNIFDRRVRTYRRYGAYWAGLHVGDLIVGVTPIQPWDVAEDVHQMRFELEMRSYNIAKWASKFASKAQVVMQFDRDGTIFPLRYHSEVQKKREFRVIDIEYDAQKRVITSESNTPPEKRWKRKEVPPHLKETMPDPMSFVFQVREEIREFLKSDGQVGEGMIVPFYDGRRRTNIDFTFKGVTDEGYLQFDFVEKPVSGYTNNEVRRLNERGIVFELYLAQHDLLPVGAYGRSSYGNARILLKEYCMDYASCLP